MERQTREKDLRDSFDTLVQKLLNSQVEALLQSTPNDKLVKIQDKFLEDLSVELKKEFNSLFEKHNLHEVLSKLDEQEGLQKLSPLDLIDKIPKNSIDEECSRLQAIFDQEKKEVETLEFKLEELQKQKLAQIELAKGLETKLEATINNNAAENEEIKKWVLDQIH